MNKLAMAFGATAALCVATTPSPSFADWSKDEYTMTTNGVTWTYKIDASAKKMFLGGGTSAGSAKMIETSTAGVLYIPTSLSHEGETYSVTDYGYGGLSSCSSLKGVVFPETTFAQTANGAGLFQSMGGCVSIWWKGPETVSSGSQPVSQIGGATQLFRYDNKLTAVVLGPNVTYTYLNSSYPFFKDTSCNVNFFIPKARWTSCPDNYITNSTSKGECKIIRYGSGEDIDVSIDGTFTVATAERLDDVLTVANDLHIYCGMNPRIAVTNAIEFTEGLITEERMEFATFNSLMFSVKTQAELDGILAAVPSSVPLAIDPSGITESLVVPAERKLFVQLGEADRVNLRVKGLAIIVK